MASQLLPILAAPFLTRLYAPTDFGMYGAVVSAAALLAIFFTLRVDHGIVVSGSDEDAKKVAVLALWLALLGASGFALISAVTFLAVDFSTSVDTYAWCIFAPLAAFFTAAARTLTLFNNRLKLFHRVSRARLLQATVVATASVLLGLVPGQTHGLIIALLLGNAAYVAILTGQHCPFPSINFPTSLRIIKKNGQFIRFSLPADLISTLTSRLPLIIFPALFGLEQTGFLALAQRVVATPSRFVGTAIGEVFYSYAAREYERDGNCSASARNVLVLLGLIGAVFFITLFLAAEPVFVFAFGEQWRPAATFTQILTPMLLVSFVVSPLSVILYIASRQRDDFIWQFAFFIVTTVACFAGVISGGLTGSLFAVSGASAIMYLLYLGLILKSAKGRSVLGGD